MARKPITLDVNKHVALHLQKSSTGCEYQMALKFVGHAPFFKTPEIRQLVLDLLEKRALSVHGVISHVHLVDYGLSFQIMMPRKYDANKFLTFTAPYLLRCLDQRYPSLCLRQTAPSRNLSRLFHRPYYLATMTPKQYPTLATYFD